MKKGLLAILIASAVSMSIPAQADYNEEQTAEIAAALKMLKIIRGEISAYNPDKPKWVENVERSQSIGCLPWIQFRVAVGLNEFMKEDEYPHIYGEIQKYLSLAAEGLTWETTFRSVAKVAAENLLILVRNPKGVVCVYKVDYQALKAPSSVEVKVDLDDSVATFEELMQALVLSGLEPKDIGADEQGLRETLLMVVKREIEKLKPRLANNSADAEGIVSSLLEQYDISPAEAGLSEEEMKAISGEESSTE